ncbi:4Fe-4S binding protein [Clostridium chrysemydis]|uniref:4Fe-4S binding protein n=1 Tax=Clostridium chrysemydis TaxID=2665504 RepID=UPI0018842AB4|nr:4Fe-4S binding protein [Clostridium chrysemydis]
MKRESYGVFFSPTGGTKKALDVLLKNIDENYTEIDLTVKDNREKDYVFKKDDLVVVAAPVYAGRIPMVTDLFSNLKGDNTPLIVMATYGNRHYDDALIQLKTILSKRGFKVIGGIAPVIPHIYSKKLGANRPDIEDSKVILEFRDKILEKLENNDLSEVYLPGNSDLEPLKEKPGSNILKYFNEGKCNNCRVCINLCPVSAISEDREIDKSLCINCMRCVKVCKSNARDFDDSKIKEYLESNYLKRREIEYYLN